MVVIAEIPMLTIAMAEIPWVTYSSASLPSKEFLLTSILNLSSASLKLFPLSQHYMSV